MDHPDQRQQQPAVPATTQMAYANPPPYQTLPAVATGTPAAPAATVSSPTNFPYHHQPNQQQQQQLQAFWADQMQEIERATDFKNHNLPLARIKKIMKADEDVRMISSEAPVIFAKACEMFILELTLRSWIHTEENKRRTLQKNDIAAAISRTDVFDFLVDIIPRDEMKEEGLGVTKAGIPLVGSGGGDGLPYYYLPPQGTGDLYAGQQHRGPLPFVPWQQTHAQQPQPPQQQPSDS